MAVRAAWLGVGGLLAVLCSLSAHAVMLEYFHVPSPHLPRLPWIRLPDHILQTGGLMAVYLLMPPRIKAAPVKAVAILALLALTVGETLFRDPFMEVVNLSNGTLYPFLDVVPLYLTAVAVACGIVATRRFLSSWPRCLAACVAVAAVCYLVVLPAAEASFVPVRAWTAAREGHGLYDPPYDWHILVPAYLTFAEPVIGAFLVCAWTSSRLPASALRAWALLSVIIFAMRGVLFGCFINIAFSPHDAVVAVLSLGQFAIENALLATIVAGTWVTMTVRRSTALAPADVYRR